MGLQPIIKEDVIEALETEDLRFETFCAFPWPSTSKKRCAVCAVGSVIRLKKPRISAAGIIETGYVLTENVCSFYPDLPFEPARNWMSALSVFWEYLGAQGTPIEEARRITIDWVEDTFPKNEVLAYL